MHMKKFIKYNFRSQPTGSTCLPFFTESYIKIQYSHLDTKVQYSLDRCVHVKKMLGICMAEPGIIVSLVCSEVAEIV